MVKVPTLAAFGVILRTVLLVIGRVAAIESAILKALILARPAIGLVIVREVGSVIGRAGALKLLGPLASETVRSLIRASI